jgi:NAD(P)H dehydrogenase (quinone)
VLRNNLYTEYLVLLGTLPGAVASGRLVSAAGQGGAAFVTREDCARAAAAALASTETANRTLDITGPAVVGYAELARIASDVSGRPVESISVDPVAFRLALIGHGVPGPLAQVLTEFQIAEAKGLTGPASTAVRDLTGKAPMSVREYVAAHRDLLLQSPAAPSVH